MTISRKAFLGAASGGAVLLLLQGCGGGGGDDDDDDGGNPPPGGQSCGSSGNAIAGNHGHMLTIPAADLSATTNRSYDITGTANHAHTVTFTPAQLQALGAGQSVMVTSSTDSAHEHVVTATCT
jgi:hypothetical protein